jgi:DNA-binding transcriptional LysR family regulator
VEDGVLIDLEVLHCDVLLGHVPDRRVNRMTAHLFYDLIPFLVDADHAYGAQPQKIEDLTPGYLVSLRETLRTKLDYARDTAQSGEQRGTIYEVPPCLWLVRNETGHFTLMYPSDY